MLGIAHDVSLEEIKRAYHTLAKQYHPDASGGDTAYEELLKSIIEAYEVLSDAQKRSEYDRLRLLWFQGYFAQVNDAPTNPVYHQPDVTHHPKESWLQRWIFGIIIAVALILKKIIQEAT